MPSWWRADTIRVEVHPGRFVFHAPRAEFELPAVVHPDEVEDAGDIILDRVRLPAVPVELFGPSGPHAPLRPLLLSAFFRRALIRCMGNRILKLKPHVVFAGASSLDPVLSGFQYEALLQAAFDAGARTVRFEPAPGEELPEGYTKRVTQEGARRSTWTGPYGH